MIIQEQDTSYIMIAQHDHASVSGKLAEVWDEKYMKNAAHKNELIDAVYEHDRGWIPIDKEPLWNDKEQKPFSFMDYPAPSKMVHYQYGINQTESTNPYGAVLQSKHYSFLTGNSEDEKEFIQLELHRQSRLLKDINITQDVLDYHFQMLQLCDSLSLFLCMYPPGSEREFSNHENGFPVKQEFLFAIEKDITGRWKDNSIFCITPSPLKQKVNVSLPYKEVFKDEIKDHGLRRAYLKTDFSFFEFFVV